MTDFNDPDMLEIIDAFCEESETLIEEMETLLEELEDDLTNNELLEKYGQIVDRIMGAAESMGFASIGTIAKLGKAIGYKGSQTNELPLKEITVSILFDANEALAKMIQNLKDRKDPATGVSSEALSERLEWLAEKFKNIKRASVGFDK